MGRLEGGTGDVDRLILPPTPPPGRALLGFFALGFRFIFIFTFIARFPQEDDLGIRILDVLTGEEEEEVADERDELSSSSASSSSSISSSSSSSFES